MTYKQVVLLILDGFGVASPSEGNPVVAANPRNLNYLINNFPATTLQASGPSVGLPWGEVGNSEVGHLNLGAGRIVSQDLPRIGKAIANEEFFKNPAFLGALAHAKKNNSKIHLLGLVSEGGVHSAEEHLDALFRLFSRENFPQVFLHMFTDGRDTLPRAALGVLDRLSRKFLELGIGKIATITGRFYAMDRGEHWEVTEQTYRAMVHGEGTKAPSAREAIQSYYDQQIYDETIPPTVIATGDQPVARIESGDAVIFFNFRHDRQVQLATAFLNPRGGKFSKPLENIPNLYIATMTEYKKGLPAVVAFPSVEIKNGIGEVLSMHQLTQINITQFHTAESEKYAHVTSFFNGGREEPWPGEEREIITSPESYQKRYQDVPEMSVAKIAETVVRQLGQGKNFILANIANCDMVGHTGNKDACVRAVQAVDAAIGAIFAAAVKAGAALVITADHGNVEEILDPRTGMVDTEHTLNPVPFIVAAPGLSRKTPLLKGYLELPGIVPEGVLSDVSPTILELFGIPSPPEMTAVSLMPILQKQVE